MNENDKYIPKVEPLETDKFFETFGKGTRLELLSSAFGIGKLTVRLQKFNEATNKEEARITGYLNADVALTFANDILTGRMAQLAKAKSANGDAVKVFEQPGGSSKDGKTIYREISLSVGHKYIFACEQCAGKKTNTGGYVRDTSNTDIPRQIIRVGMDAQTLKAMALMIKSEYQAYRTAQYIRLYSVENKQTEEVLY